MAIRFPAAALMAAIALAASWPAEAKQPNLQSESLRMVPDERESFSRAAAGRVSDETGYPLALYRVNFSVKPGTPEAMAREYLRAAGPQLGLRSPDLADLRHRATRHGLATITVRFDQTVQGVPVYESEVTVSLNRHAMVTYVMNGYKSRVSLPDLTPAITAQAARATALAHLHAQGELQYEKTELVVYPGKAGSRLAYRVRVEPGLSPLGHWDVLVDARSGEVFRAEDRACYRQAAAKGDTPAVDGAGTVFNLDPLSSSGGTTYGTGGFVDGNDADTPDLTGQLINVTLRDIDFTGGIHTLKGPWAEVQDFESPFKGLFTQAGSTFNFTREPDAFEAANTYYHIDKIMRYINGTGPTDLGLNVRPFAYPTGVRYDPSGFNGADNSHYLSGSQRLAFGEGGVDDAEDADVIIHELGHGLHDWVTNGSLSQVQGLSEGSGDYIAASYSRAANLVPQANPHFNWVFNWDGHNPFWPGRVTNWPNLYPGGLTGQIHTDGQIWATCLMRIWNQLGAIKTDKVFLEGLGMTNSATNQDDAAQALMQAAFDLGYTLPEQTIMFNEFTATGYTVVIVPVDLMSVTVE